MIHILIINQNIILRCHIICDIVVDNQSKETVPNKLKQRNLKRKENFI